MAQVKRKAIEYHTKVYPGDVYLLNDFEFNNKHHEDLTSINTIRYQRPCVVIKVNTNRTYGVIPLTTKDNGLHLVYPMQIESHIQTFALLSNYLTVDENRLGQLFSCLKPKILEDLRRAYTQYISGNSNKAFRTQPMIYNKLDCKALESWKYYDIFENRYLSLKLMKGNQILIRVKTDDGTLDYENLTFVGNRLLRNINPILVNCEYDENNRIEIANNLEKLYGISLSTKNIHPMDYNVFKMLNTIDKEYPFLEKNKEKFIKAYTNFVLTETGTAINGKFFGHIYASEHIRRDIDIHIIVPYILYQINIFSCNAKILQYIKSRYPNVLEFMLRPYKRVFYLDNKTNKIFDGNKAFFSYKIQNMYILHDFLNKSRQ